MCRCDEEAVTTSLDSALDTLQNFAKEWIIKIAENDSQNL